MTDLLPSKYIAGVVIFIFMVMAGVAIFADVGLKNHQVLSDPQYSEFNDTFNKYEDINTQVNTLKSGIENSGSTDFGLFGILNSLINSAWQSLKLIFSSFGFVNDIFNGLSSFFGIPAWIPAILILLITVGLVFAIWAAIFQREL
jgi:hypothetical protein